MSAILALKSIFLSLLPFGTGVCASGSHAILNFMNSETDHDLEWLKSARGSAWSDWLLTALDAFEPLAPLGAQFIFMAQPWLGHTGGERWGSLARALESADGIEQVRACLRDERA